MRKVVGALGLSVLLAFGLAACSSNNKSTKHSKLDPFAGKGSPHYNGKGAIPEGGGRYHIGKPYQVAGRWYTPKADPNYDRKGTASWYGEAFHARKTANGEWFDMNDLTAAHPTLPIPSYAKVTNLENGNELVVRINDRGPFVGTRLIDLSKASSKVLDFKHQGKANVRVQWIGDAPLNDKGYAHLRMMNQTMVKGASIRQLAQAAERKAPSTMMAEAPVRKKKRGADSGAQQASLYQASTADAPPPQQSASRSGGYVVQVATFKDLNNAQGAAGEMAAHGPTRLLETETEQGKVYRLQVGPMMEKDDAVNALYAVRDNGYPDARLARIVIQQVSSNQ